MYKFLCTCIGILFSPLLWANAWTVSIPYSHWDPSKPWNQRFQYTAILYLTEDSFKSTEPLNVTCSETRPCYIQINTQQKGNPHRAFYPDPNIPRIRFSTGTTVGEALRAYFLQGTNHSYIYTVSSSASDRASDGVAWCGAMGISHSESGPGYVVMAGGECANIAPPNVQCNLETENVDINHGQLSISEVINGQAHVKEGNFRVYCNQDVNVMLSITSPDKDTSQNNSGYIGTKIRLKDDGSLVSYLSIDGKDFSTPTNVPIAGGGTTFDVKSTLVGTGATVVPGPFLSFAYVTISFE